jgi:O-glycosyl hydrolase
MDGFGFALTGGSAQLLMRMGAAPRTALLKELFTTGGGIGVSYLRVSIGASDMNERVYSYDDLQPGETDVEMVSNTGNFPKSFAVKYHGKVFQTAIPAESVGTYVW